MKTSRIFLNGIIHENPVFVQMLGMCPVLAVTTSGINAIGMGLATTAVLLCANVVIAALKNIIPSKIRIPAFIVVIATFVTIVGMLLEAFLPALNKSLGLFIPLIVVNCIILGRAEAFASKNSIGKSFIDGLAMGLGFTVALVILGVIREVLGKGEIFGYTLSDKFEPIGFFGLAPGAFLTLGLLLALFNVIGSARRAKEGN